MNKQGEEKHTQYGLSFIKQQSMTQMLYFEPVCASVSVCTLIQNDYVSMQKNVERHGPA